ncbi:MAG: ATP-binding protein [Spirochaetota bacterium]
MDETRIIGIDSNSPLLDTHGMFYKEFPSDFRQTRYFTLLVIQKAPPEFREINLLEQQISELIKNAIKHGNKNQREKKVKVWYSFEDYSARVVVQDEGEGFERLEEWNEFLKQRTRCFVEQDFEEMDKYISWQTEQSDFNDGGNALFAAVEYWDGGIVFNNKKNCVGVKKTFPRRQIGVSLSA